MSQHTFVHMFTNTRVFILLIIKKIFVIDKITDTYSSSHGTKASLAANLSSKEFTAEEEKIYTSMLYHFLGNQNA